MSAETEFQRRLEERMDKEYGARCESFIFYKCNDPHDNAHQRGYLNAIRDMGEWIKEVAKSLYDTGETR